jgi:hypothetical protein
MDPLACFPRIWVVDFEFQADDGHRPQPRCVVARELRSGQTVRRWLMKDPPARPPYDVDERSLFVAYYASAEVGSHLALGWPVPARVLDLYAEFRCKLSGLTSPHGWGLLGALAHYGEGSISTEAKEAGRALAMKGGPYTEGEKQALIDYCTSDVDGEARLLVKMLPDLDLPRALLRGRYMVAAARMEHTGTPLDTAYLARLRKHWRDIKLQLIPEVNATHPVLDGITFKRDLFAAYLERCGIPWPCKESGALDLEDETFREMARVFPAEIGPIREVRHTLSQLRLNELAVGPDGRNRTLLSAFGSKTGRNTPSNSKSIFGPSIWLRSLIKPERGHAVAYLDWKAQELAIAACLSGDPRMREMYRAPDPYLHLAKMARAVPDTATADSHPRERETFKAVALGVLYGLSAFGIARKLDVPLWQGQELLTLHQQLFPVFWRWADAVEMTAMLTNQLRTVFGWAVHVPPGLHPKTGSVLANPRSYRNFPVQAHGAEMLRLACCLATERGIEVCAPVHDALVVEGPARLIEDVAARTRQAMEEASLLVLPDFPLRVKVEEVAYPRCYRDKRGAEMWDKIGRIMNRLTGGEPVAPVHR